MRLRQIEIRYFYGQGRSLHYLYSWGVGILESNAKLNSRLGLKLKLTFELSLAIEMGLSLTISIFERQFDLHKATPVLQLSCTM